MLLVVACGAVAAPLLTTHNPIRQFAGYENAPPMRPHVFDSQWRPTRPFVYPIELVDRLARRYIEDRERPVPIRWFTGGVVASVDESAGPWLPLGGDPLGRDVFARLVHGTRLSLGVACIASIGALVLGALVGGAAGFLGGRVDQALMGLADFVLVLPAIYVVLAFRAALPLVLTVPQVFGALVVVLIAAGWPIAARGVRAIVATERRKEYAEAAYALGAGPLRILLRHLLPSTASFLLVTWTMMVPAFVLTESTMSLVGLGFPVPTASWGTMLRDAWQGGALVDAPWLMAPAFAVVLSVFALHLLTTGRDAEDPRAGTFS
ncbi:MAG: ABC transporter permease [Vicinamibacterales bacterium]